MFYSLILFAKCSFRGVTFYSLDLLICTCSLSWLFSTYRTLYWLEAFRAFTFFFSVAVLSIHIYQYLVTVPNMKSYQDVPYNKFRVK